VGALPDIRGTLIYSGKKTQVVRLDSLSVNTAQDITRDVLGRVPGLNISETQNSGFPSNGIGFRGLNPVQSVEMNVRQDGVNIVADLYGYPETYYSPPAEALERVEFVRGSSSLQFGPQFGGVIDYVLRDGRENSAPAFSFRQTTGSFGLFNSYLSLSGGTGRWTYFAYAQYRGQNGWRPNSDLRQVSAAGRVRYRASDRVRLSLEYSLLRNRIHMPGGLDDEEFNADSRASFRARNWLASPWNIIAATADVQLSPTARLTSTLSTMFSQRYLVWRNEDGGPAAPDTIDPATNAFVPREVEWEYFSNVMNETRLLKSYSLFGTTHTLATGVRAFAGRLHRQEGGVGTTGSDFNTSLVGPYETDVRFDNRNVAVFAENVFRIGTRLSVTPGLRLEYLHSTVDGYTDTVITPRAKDRSFLLAGVGAQYSTSATTDLYANITQAYRPIEYSYLTPFASLTRIDPNLKDPKGYNADLGWRGSLGRALSFDVGLFYLAYHDRIGLVSGVDSLGTPFTERRNVANSVHKGMEGYLEVRPLGLLGVAPSWGTLTLYDALGYVHARYVTGEFAGHTVEYAPTVVNRFGVTYALGQFTTKLQASSVSKQFSDANNTIASEDATVGVIPAYHVLDWSAKYRLNPRLAIETGVNNVADNRYFTMRTSEYPGPGIIPGIGRSVYLTLSAGL
jgi:Fe(3+) dicitrate transport protein